MAFGVVGNNDRMTDARIHQYLVSHPEVVFEMASLAQQKQADEDSKRQQAAVDKLGMKSFFNPAVAYVTGPANAKHTFVEFFDYNCVHCRNSFPVVQKFYEDHKNDTRFAFIDYPIFGRGSNEAAQMAVAARKQGDLYVKLNFALMSETGSADGSAVYDIAKKVGLNVKQLMADVVAPGVNQTLAQAHRLADEADVTGTPTFIIDGKVHAGEITQADLKQLMKS